MTTTPSKLQNSLASKTKSPIKYSIREDSPSRAITKSKATDSKLQQMSTRRQNLLQCFDIYQLLFQNNAPQRCIAHNNFLTLYCQNQHKLLCVNCIYGDSSHKNHRVIPIKNAFKKIEQDNQLMKKHLKQYIQQIKLFERNTLSAKQQAEANLKAMLHQLQDQYNLTVHTIQDKYHRMRQSIISAFRNDGAHVQLLTKEVDWLKQTYIQRQRGLPTSDEESSLIYTHNLLTLMLQNDNLRQQKVDVVDTSQLKNNTINQLKRIVEVIGNVSSHTTKKRIF